MTGREASSACCGTHTRRPAALCVSDDGGRVHGAVHVSTEGTFVLMLTVDNCAAIQLTGAAGVTPASLQYF